MKVRQKTSARFRARRIPPAFLETYEKAWDDFKPLAAQIHFEIRALASGINDASATWLQPLGLTAAKINVIAMLGAAGANGLPLKALGALLHTHGPHVTSLVAELERDGYVRRAENPADRRSQLATLTAKGRRLQQRAFPKHFRGQAELLAALTDDEQRQLLALLEKINADLGDRLD